MLDLPHDARLLIVDDSELYCYLAALACGQAGLSACETCTTIPYALTAIPRFRPDACLLDVCLGLDRSTEVARLLADRDIPFAVCSGDEPPQEFHQFAADLRYLRKPSPVDKMIATVRDLLDSRPANPAELRAGNA